MTDLVIVGAGGFARETVAAVRAINAERPTWRLRGFLDDDPAKQGRQRGGVPVLGRTALIHEHPDAAVVVCIGNPRDYQVRARMVARLDLPVERYATIVHPTVQLAPGCQVGPGAVLLAQVVLTADVVVGAHVAVMPHAVLTHDNVIEDYATIASGVRLGGGVRVCQGGYLGAGALIRESVTVGAGSLVGMGSVVLQDVPPNEVWVGNPARRLRATDPATGTSADPAAPSRRRVRI
jgi:sugar O-acyltransferase (sialic acid O-acetyltransferase NeuD family)